MLVALFTHTHTHTHNRPEAGGGGNGKGKGKAGKAGKGGKGGKGKGGKGNGQGGNTLSRKGGGLNGGKERYQTVEQTQQLDACSSAVASTTLRGLKGEGGVATTEVEGAECTPAATMSAVAAAATAAVQQQRLGRRDVCNLKKDKRRNAEFRTADGHYYRSMRQFQRPAFGPLCMCV